MNWYIFLGHEYSLILNIVLKTLKVKILMNIQQFNASDSKLQLRLLPIAFFLTSLYLFSKTDII